MNCVSIVTVNFNETAVTVDLLRSVFKHKGEYLVEVILVDNGCTDQDEEIFKNTYPDLIYIRSEQNLGFAGGNNLGLQVATGKYILFLNNDTEIVPNTLSTLISEMDNHPEIGLLSPLILYYDEPDIIQYAGFSKMNYFTARNKTIGKMDTNTGQYDHISMETGFCHGAAMMCRRDDLREVGTMDENYFLYYEEMDWCEKFKRAGKKIWFTGKTKVYHKESISVGKKSALKAYFISRNRLLYIRKNASKVSQVFFWIYYCTLVSPALIIKYSFTGKNNLAKWVWKGVMWNVNQAKDSKIIGYPLH